MNGEHTRAGQAAPVDPPRAGATVAAAAGWPLLLSLGAVYLIWGSTYLAIQLALKELPPFTMVAARFLVAGALLYGWTRFRGAPEPARAHWRTAAITGLLMLTIGNGAVVWAQQRVPSGLAALIVATVPLWIVAFDWLFGSRTRPGRLVLLGIAIGTLGVAVLLGRGGRFGVSQVDPIGGLALLCAPVAWAAGSLYSRRAPLPASTLETTAMQMLCGGAIALPLALAASGPSLGAPADLSPRAIACVAYLALFGSIVAFSAYVWLLKHTTPALATSYAYVNPVVAMTLGWLFAGEALTGRSAAAAALILAAVVLITLAVNRGRGGPAAPATDSARAR